MDGDIATRGLVEPRGSVAPVAPLEREGIAELGRGCQAASGCRRLDGFQYSVARPEDDAEIRRLLRENPMPGEVSVSLEREPNSALAASIERDLHRSIVACQCATRWSVALGS